MARHAKAGDGNGGVDFRRRRRSFDVELGVEDAREVGSLGTEGAHPFERYTAERQVEALWARAGHAPGGGESAAISRQAPLVEGENVGVQREVGRSLEIEVSSRRLEMETRHVYVDAAHIARGAQVRSVASPAEVLGLQCGIGRDRIAR